jgi:tetratricopeptide (TPR) repeat protein
VIADDNGIIIMNKAHASPFNKPETMTVQEAIYKYFDFTWDYSAEKFQVALQSLQKAVQTEPENPLALALLSGLYMDAYITDLTPDPVLLDKAVVLAQSAVILDPHCQHAQKALAWAFLLLSKKEKSMEAIDQCIKLNPKASSIISTMALAYICQGEFNRGFKWLLESIHLNPVTTVSAKISFGLFYFHKGDYEECGKWLERLHPVETPFIKLLQLSLFGKMHKKKKLDIDESVLALKDHVVSIIGRKLFDETLKNQILDGLKLADLTVK